MFIAGRKPLKVFTGNSYPYRRNTDLGQANVNFTRRKMTPLRNIWISSVAFTIVEPFYDLIHTINCIPLFSTCPYFITVESFLPRMWPTGALSRSFFAFLRRQLLDEKCVKILAMSQFAIRLMAMQNQGYKDWPAVAEKIELFYPCVDIKEDRPKTFTGNKIRLIAVGHDFMRKGFPALVRAHEKLNKQGLEVETTIVSALKWSESDFIGPPSKNVFDEEMDRLKNSSINVFSSLPNAEVMKLMRQCHFLVLPTLHDTFGYVSIEAFSVGTPVLATALCAQPEIITDKANGFLIPIETDLTTGRWTWFDRNKETGYTEAYLAQIESSSERIVEIISGVAERTEDYEKLSFNALETARSKFNRDIQRARLEKMYEAAVGL